MSVNFVPVDHQQVISAIDNWARRQHGAIAPMTLRFFDDMRSHKHLEYWARVPIDRVVIQHIPRPRVLLALRSIAMLLPILLTWLALSQMVDDFSRYVQNVDPSANFLWFWQTNPENQFLSVWTLQHIALLDAVLLVFVVVISVRISWYENSVVDELEKRHEEMTALISVYLCDFSGAREMSHHGHTNHHQNGSNYSDESERFVQRNYSHSD